MFDETKVRRYNLILSPANVAALEQDIVGEKYVEASITTDYGSGVAGGEETFHGVGVRYKGAVGSLRVCLDPRTGVAHGQCRKLSLKVDSNKFRKVKALFLCNLSFSAPLTSISLSGQTAHSWFKKVVVPRNACRLVIII